ncbi:MAG: alanine/glycine:cation symporter family protein [Bacteroidales bacterium]|jgi:AGCS family alanine or glycine:cation symporter|nr:alanine/glycine:cation symporter family protein [Bacteroidales bacterium]MDD3299487.1 alanine/glycine:cation symporter family protein [Bacteroidales bacterium]MDD3844019.1 alanine/glycine:cation symporter family protein [Bacteroidales bacterium]MDD4618472.1 alanine/glycine:cation symporter family protein [Bacteroidales bacterium]
MKDFWTTIEGYITSFSDMLGMPLFVVLIGGGVFFMIYSGFVPFRYYMRAIKALKSKDNDAPGQISSFEALTSAIAATVGMGSISGVAVAITMGGPGAIFWMWVSAAAGMATKFFEGSLTIMYKGKDSEGELQGGPMYMITKGLGPKWKPMAVFFSIFGLIGTLCLWQANQLTEAITSVLHHDTGLEATFGIKLGIGVTICALVSVVILGGIKRISKVSSKVVPGMVALYFILVAYIIFTNLPEVPAVFSSIFEGAFNFKAGAGGLAGTAIIIGVRRATLVNEAGVGTASMMHGASRNKQPIREGLVAMIGPSIDSGLVCTLTALAILINGNYEVSQIQGIEIAMNSFERSIPGLGNYLLMFMVTIFAFSTMFSYSYYGVKCTSFLFGAKYAEYYNYFFLLMLVVGSVISLDVVVGIVDSAYALMAFPTMLTMFVLAPKVKREMKKYFAS